MTYSAFHCKLVHHDKKTLIDHLEYDSCVFLDKTHFVDLMGRRVVFKLWVSQYKRHMSSSTGTQYRCEKCGGNAVFNSLAELEEHNRKKHP
jgi:hypothetical protein